MTPKEHGKARDAYERKLEQARRKTTMWKIVARVLTFATIPPAICLMMVHLLGIEGKYASVAGGLLSVPFSLAIIGNIDRRLHGRLHRDALRIHDELFSGASGSSR